METATAINLLTSMKHVPEFIEKAEKLKSKGVDEILCISVPEPPPLKPKNSGQPPPKPPDHHTVGKLSSPSTILTQHLASNLPESAGNLSQNRLNMHQNLVENLTSGNTHVIPTLQVDQPLHGAPTDVFITTNKTVNPDLQNFFSTTNSDPTIIISGAVDATHGRGPPPPHHGTSNEPMGHIQFRTNKDESSKAGSGVSALVTTPLDPIKTRLQVLDGEGNGRGLAPTVLQTMRNLVKEGGVSACYKGLGPRWVSMSMPSSKISGYRLKIKFN